MDEKARDHRSHGIPAPNCMHCPKCGGRNFFIIIVEPGSTPVYQCEQCSADFWDVVHKLAHSREIPAGQGALLLDSEALLLGDAPFTQSQDTSVILSPRQYLSASNDRLGLQREVLERIPGGLEGSQMADGGVLPPEAEVQPRQDPVAAESDTAETGKKDAPASQQAHTIPIRTCAQPGATDQSPLAHPEPDSGRARKKPGPKGLLDPYWDSDIEPMLKDDPDAKLKPKAIMHTLRERYPGVFDMNKFKTLTDTLRRKMKTYRESKAPRVPSRKVDGSESEASKDSQKSNGSSLSPERGPGRQLQEDFTHFDKMEVTIKGKAVPVVLFDCRSPYSGWTYAEAFGGETVSAVSEGLQNALARLDGVPEELHRDRHGSAIWKGEAIDPLKQVLEHYSLKLSLTPPGCPWKNGSVERTNGVLKENLEQILLIRGHSNFESREDLQKAVQQAVDWINVMPEVQRKLVEERKYLRPLPAGTVPTYKSVMRTVKRYGWIELYGYLYSVPLGAGTTVFVRLYDDRTEIYRENPDDYRGGNLQPAITWPRLHNDRGAQIFFRHLLRPSIAGLVSASNEWRKDVKEAIWPGICFEQTHRYLKNWCMQEEYRSKRRVGSLPGDDNSETRAAIEYARIRALGADPAREKEAAKALRQLLKKGEPFFWEDVHRLMKSPPAGGHNIGTLPLF